MNDGHLNILLVEDNPGDARLVAEMLKEPVPGSFKLAHAGSLKTALERMREKRFDAVLMDMNLPDCAGLNGLEEVSARHPGTPVIVLTGVDNEELGLEAVRKRAADYLIKGRIDGNLLARSVCYSIERKKRETELALMNRILKARGENDKAMMNAEDEFSYLQKVCGIIVKLCGHTMVWIGYADEGPDKSVKPVAFSGFEKGYLENLDITWDNTARGRGPTGTAIRTGEPVCCRNIITDPLFEPWRGEALKRGYSSSVALPLISNGKVLGALNIYSKDPDSFNEDEVHLITELANDLAFGISSIRLRSQLKLTVDALKDSEERYRVLTDTSPDAIIVHRNGVLLYANPAALRLYRADTFEQLAAHRILDLVHAQDREQPEVRMRLLDGHEVIIEILSAPIIYKGKRAVQAVLHNITERVKVREILQRDKQTLEKLVQDKALELLDTQLELEKAKRLSDIGTLAATVAHELRNPLAAISMAASNIKRKAANPLLDKHLSNIDKKITESNQIISNLLFYSRIRMPRFETVDLAEIIRECVENSQNIASHRTSARIGLDIAGAIRLESDPLQLKEVFSNLLNNALDAVAAAEHGDIRISASENPDSVDIMIKDTGTGIDKEIIDKVFEPFFTTKAKGTGLGLYVCQQIVKLHGGAITIESKPAKSTVVGVNLPKEHKNVKEKNTDR